MRKNVIILSICVSHVIKMEAIICYLCEIATPQKGMVHRNQHIAVSLNLVVSMNV